MFKFIFNDLGVPIGTPIQKRDSADYLAAAAMVNQSLNNAIQAGDSTAQRNQAEHFFQEGWMNQFKSLLMQMDYNSQLRQRERLEAAGYSPYALFGQNGGSSVSSSLGNSTQVPSTIPNFDNSAFSQSAQMLNAEKVATAQSAALSQEAAGAAIDNFSRDARNNAQIRQLLSSAGLNDANAAGQQINNLILANSRDSLIAANQEQVNLIKSNIQQNLSQVALNNAMQIKTSKETSWIDSTALKQLSVMGSQIALNSALQRQSFASAQASLAQAVMYEAQARNQNISADTAQSIAGQIMNQEFYKSAILEAKYNNLSEYGSEEIRNFFDKTSQSPFQQYVGGEKREYHGQARKDGSHSPTFLNTQSR